MIFHVSDSQMEQIFSCSCCYPRALSQERIWWSTRNTTDWPGLLEYRLFIMVHLGVIVQTVGWGMRPDMEQLVSPLATIYWLFYHLMSQHQRLRLPLGPWRIPGQRCRFPCLYRPRLDQRTPCDDYSFYWVEQDKGIGYSWFGEGVYSIHGQWL